ALSVPPPVLWADSGLWQQQMSSTDHKTLPEQIKGSELAYIIYTSGTTGHPKGVMLEHQHLLNRIDWMQQTYPLSASDKVLQKTPYIFDVSVWELVWATAYGAQIVLAEPEGHKDPDYLYQLITEQHITVLHFVPTMFQAFLDDLKRRGRSIPSSLRFIFCSGEALSVATVQLFQQLNQSQTTELHNLYGPTETAIDSSFYHCTGELGSVPIGKPIQNTQLYILDSTQQLVPKGVVGELYIAGHGVARGYLNLPELTAERFLSNPFYHATTNACAGNRMYKTGDRVRMLADGNIEYLGRNDFQVKLRGFRIELAEIETALCALPHISQALVMVKQAGGQDVLVAYCQTDVLPEPQQIRAVLLQQLPEYMVPEHFIGLSRFPVNVNGKLDRKALPEPELKADHYVAPATEQEKQLVALWQHYLKLDKVGVEDDFFRLGGNSILAISVSHAMAELLKLHYPVARLFTDKTIRHALLNSKPTKQQQQRI
ncbi:MAG: non-ribosomal peptide synthetase, partial [Pararheinheimera sp.]|nr:non-ribosomal peptide synthetase [Rheinheimera sp.]